MQILLTQAEYDELLQDAWTEDQEKTLRDAAKEFMDMIDTNGMLSVRKGSYTYLKFKAALEKK